MTSLVQLAHEKNAIDFKAALEEKISEKVDTAISAEKVEVASRLLGEAGVSGGVKKVWKKPAIKGKPQMPKVGAPRPGVREETEQLDEREMAVGDIEHMRHAVHACHSGHCDAHSTRGTFTHFIHPDYHIHRDNGNIDPDRHEMAYHVMGPTGHHKFTVEPKNGKLDVKHVGQIA